MIRTRVRRVLRFVRHYRGSTSDIRINVLLQLPESFREYRIFRVRNCTVVFRRFDWRIWSFLREGSLGENLALNHQAIEVELCVCQTKPKLVSWSDIIIVKIFVVDEKTFAKVLLWYKFFACRHDLCARPVVGEVLSNSVRQCARRVYISKQDIDKSIARFLTWKVCVKNGFHIWNVSKVFHEHRADGMDDDDNISGTVTTVIANVSGKLIST